MAAALHQPAAGTPASPRPRVNGVDLNPTGEALTPEDARQRACTELLRQAAIDGGLLDATDPGWVDGVVSEGASAAIDAWLERELRLSEPSEDACRRHHAANAARFRSNERVQARHILFAVTPGVDVVRLRNRAEACLLDVRCHDGQGSAFASAARELSNCPSGEDGGDLGWLVADDCAPEFARELFGHPEVGVLPRLVHSRYGLHVVEVLERDVGEETPFEAVREAVGLALSQQSWVTGVRQCLLVLAGQAKLEGVELESSATPLVQ